MKVMIAVDASDIAAKAFDFYMKNIHKNENKVFVVSEVERPYLPHSTYTHTSYLPEEEIKAIMAEHHKTCNHLKHTFVDMCKTYKDMELDYEVIVETTSTKVAEGIIKKAQSLEVGMIVMGTRGHGVLRRTIIGSVSDYVLHHSHIPVMICHVK